MNPKTFPNREFERIRQALPNMDRARKGIFDYFVSGVNQGMPIPQLVGILTDDRSGLFHPRNDMGRKETVELIDYVKTIDIARIYETAGVPLERDLMQNPNTGAWVPRDSDES